MKTIVQISLDITNIPEAIETAHLAVRSGVDWLEAGTPLIIAEGMNGVRALRREFPHIPIVADQKTMDGGWLGPKSWQRRARPMSSSWSGPTRKRSKSRSRPD